MKNYKKTLALLLMLVLVASLFTGCGKKGGNAKIGLAVITSADHASKDAGEKDGQAQADSTAAAVLLDSKGVIKDVVIDVIQTKILFSTEGVITSDRSEIFVSKHELKDGYKMKDASPIGKEWFEQAEALENYIIGKTIDEVKGIKVDDGYPAEEALTSSVTMAIGDMIAAVVKAAEKAEALGASDTDKIGLGIVSNIGKSSKDATDGEDGVAQAYSTYAAITVDKNNKITSSVLDASQSNVTFNNTGVITSELTGVFKTKLELGNEYNMKDSSAIKKEWFEQAKAFSDYIKGKTVADVKGIALTDGVATDLSSSVTITVTDFITTIEKAGASAAK